MKLKYIITAFLLTALIGCQRDYLTEESKSALTQDQYFQTASQAASFINGLYPTLHTFQQEIEYQGDAVWSLMEMPVGHNRKGGSLYKTSMIEHTSSPSDPLYYIVWGNFYNGIANANLAISKIPNTADISKEDKSKLLGEAYFLRALYYFYLVRLYGEIPLITEPVSFGSNDIYPSKSSVDKIYELIVSDLKSAETSNMPLVDRGGRASIGAAKSLLSSVYLTMAGYPLNKGKEYFKLSADKAKEVIDMNQYTLFTNYLHLHDRSHKNQGELIFQVQYLAGVKTNRITEFVSPSGISKLQSSLGTVAPTTEFYNSYEKGDKRVAEKQFYFTQDLAADSQTKVVSFAPALYKFYLEEAAGKGGDKNSDENWTLLRMPEILLNYAEASNETYGPTDEAYRQINKIRNRAGLAPLEGLSQNDFREAIWRERYHELAFENKSYFDLQRTRKAYNLKSGQFINVIGFVNELGVSFSEKDLLWPLPQKEVDANKNLKQNSGW